MSDPSYGDLERRDVLASGAELLRQNVWRLQHAIHGALILDGVGSEITGVQGINIEDFVNGVCNLISRCAHYPAAPIAEAWENYLLDIENSLMFMHPVARTEHIMLAVVGNKQLGIDSIQETSHGAVQMYTKDEGVGIGYAPETHQWL